MGSILVFLVIAWANLSFSLKFSPGFKAIRTKQSEMKPNLIKLSSGKSYDILGVKGLDCVIGTTGIASSFVCFYSLYVLGTTGCGLPPGPFGILGAIEGLSYLSVSGIFIWSLVTKLITGKGLPAGAGGLLGGAEGLSFLTVLLGIAVALFNLNHYGYLPGFLPDSKCYGA